MAEEMVRPSGASSVVVERVAENGVRVRVVMGWRRAQISVVVDAVVRGGRDLWPGQAERGYLPEAGESVSAAARRMGVHRSEVQRRMRPEHYARTAVANTRAWRDKWRPVWEEYCRAYRARFPGSTPIGFQRWANDGWRVKWLADPDSALVQNFRNQESARKALGQAAQFGSRAGPGAEPQQSRR